MKVETIIKTLNETNSDGLLTLIIQVILLFLIVFLIRYLHKKAEHLATTEYFDTYKEQLIKIEEETSEIKNKISNEYLTEHEQWSLKRKIYLALIETLQSLSDLIARLIICFKENEPSEFKNEYFSDSYKKDIQPLGDLLNNLNKLKAKGRIVLNDKSISRLDEMTKNLLTASGKPFDPVIGNRETFIEILQIVGDALNDLTKIAKDDLANNTFN